MFDGVLTRGFRIGPMHVCIIIILTFSLKRMAYLSGHASAIFILFISTSILQVLYLLQSKCIYTWEYKIFLFLSSPRDHAFKSKCIVITERTVLLPYILWLLSINWWFTFNTLRCNCFYLYWILRKAEKEMQCRAVLIKRKQCCKLPKNGNSFKAFFVSSTHWNASSPKQNACILPNCWKQTYFLAVWKVRRRKKKSQNTKPRDI